MNQWLVSLATTPVAVWRPALGARSEGRKGAGSRSRVGTRWQRHRLQSNAPVRS